MATVSLAELIASEAGVALDRVMLLRHSNARLSELAKRGGSIEEYTRVQPTDSKYDYTQPGTPPIDVIAVIVGDDVHAVYRITGIEAEGTTYSLVSPAHRQIDIDRKRPERPAKKFRMARFESVSVGQTVRGWESRSRTPVQRSSGSFFLEITVDVAEPRQIELELRAKLERDVQESLRTSASERKKRLDVSPRHPTRIAARTWVFARNPDVIATVLCRASGVCEGCRMPAPFKRKSDGTAYLEVHHRIRLSDGGEDTVENAVALCPNCHRAAHYAQ